MNKQEAKEIYFKYYDLLPKDIGDKAKAYFLSTDRTEFNKPVDVGDTLMYGFTWTETKEDHDYWNIIYERFDGVVLTDSVSGTTPDPFLYYLEGVYDGLGGDDVKKGDDMLVDIVSTILDKYKQLKH